MPEYRDGELELEQLSIFLGDGFVVTFQETPGDCFGPVRERIRRHQGSRDRLLRADYLCYALLDAVVDAYFPVLESLSDELDAVENAVVGRPRADLVSAIYSIKRELQALRRTVWPQRELFRSLMRDLTPVAEETRVYLRDCEDHAVQIMDVVETYRERASSALDLYVTSINHRMNEVMKVLTIMATIFMPLTVITGIYGMNFDAQASPWNMPELAWRYGYPYALGLLLTVALGLVLAFKQRGWIGQGRKRRKRRQRRKR
jgi:magnesium transporter